MKQTFKLEILLPAFSGLLLAVSYPPLPLGFVAWFALVPLLISIRHSTSREALRRGLIFAFVHSAAALYFISFNSGAPPILAISSWLAAVLILSLLGPMFTLPMSLAFRKWGNIGLIGVPFYWALIEYLRSLGEIAFPWNILPLTQSMYLPVCQLAAYSGIWGISFWVAGANVFFYLAHQKNKLWLIPAVVWVGGLFLWGSMELKSTYPISQSLDVAIVQGNISPASKWANGLNYSLELYRELTENIEDADLIVWPETAVPARLNIEIRARRSLKKLAEEIATPIFTGALALDELPDDKIQRFNSAYLLKPDNGNFTRYDKIHLVPFGERVPFQGLIPQLGNLNFGQAEFTPGKDFVIFELDSYVSFGAMICYETVVPSISRAFVDKGADFLVNVTNDGWYGKTSEPMQQGLLTRFRSIESGRSMVRAANTGVSFVFDPQGRVLAQSKLETVAILRAEVPITDYETYYRKNREIIIKVLVIIPLLFLLLTAAVDLHQS